MTSDLAIGKLKIILIIDLIVVGFVASGFLYLQSTGQIDLAPKEAKFELTNLDIFPSQVIVGEPVTISVNVTNIGDLDGNHSLSLIVNGTLAPSKINPRR